MTFIGELLILALKAAPPAPASGVPREVLNLAQIRRNVLASALEIPGYACLETIERFGRDSQRKPFRQLDSLQLEVGISANREVYAWPGADKFEDAPPGELVGSGTVSTGEFVQLARAVFIGGTSTIVWYGEEELSGRKALRYDFTLPLYGYRSRVSIAGASGEVSLKGTFWADAETLQLMRLDSQADEVAAGLPLAAMNSRILYGQMTINGRQVRFPQSAEFRLLDLAGQETFNRIEFSHCRPFVATSTLRFDEPAAAETDAPKRTVTAIELPEGVNLDLRLDSAIESSTAGVGQEVTATLASNAVHKKKILIPAGAVVRGRIRRLERSTELEPHFVVGIEFTTIEHQNLRARFYGRMEWIEQAHGIRSLLANSATKTNRYAGSSSVQQFRVETGKTETLRFRDIPGVGSFFVTGTQFALPRGIRMTWVTVALPKPLR